jgi:hypothetical protein
MKRAAILALIALLTACGSDNGGSTAPTNTFTGNWSGNYIVGTDTAHFILAAAQNGSDLNGVGYEIIGNSSGHFEFTGATTPPNVTLVLDYDYTFLMYTGTYVTNDSIAGTATDGVSTFPLDIARH